MDPILVGEKRPYGRLLASSDLDDTHRKRTKTNARVPNAQIQAQSNFISTPLAGKKTTRESFELGELRADLPSGDTPESTLYAYPTGCDDYRKISRIMYHGDSGSTMQSITSPGQLRRIQTVPHVPFPSTAASSSEGNNTEATSKRVGPKNANDGPVDAFHHGVTSLPTATGITRDDSSSKRPELYINNFDAPSETIGNPVRSRRSLTQCFVPTDAANESPIFSIPVDALKTAREVGPRSLIYNAPRAAENPQQVPPMTPPRGLLLLKNEPEFTSLDLDEDEASDSTSISGVTMDMDNAADATTVVSLPLPAAGGTIAAENPQSSWIPHEFDPQLHTPDRQSLAISRQPEEDPKNPSPPKYDDPRSMFFHDIT